MFLIPGGNVVAYAATSEAMMAVHNEQPFTPEQSSWKETKKRHHRDIELRVNGWSIYSRVKGQEPVWERKGERRKQSEIKI
jgi:hypothetical protein